jgi:hypothetical protein
VLFFYRLQGDENMSNNKLHYEEDHYCPLYNKIINPDVCYESMMCLHRFFKISSVKELAQIEDIDKVRMKCEKCKYSEEY